MNNSRQVYICAADRCLCGHCENARAKSCVIHYAPARQVSLCLNNDCEDGEAAARFAEEFFVAIGQLSGNSVIVEANFETNARLHALRRSEPTEFADCRENLNGMLQLFEAGWFSETDRGGNYHRQRVGHIREIIHAGTTGSGDEVAHSGKVTPFSRAANGNAHGDNRHARD